MYLGKQVHVFGKTGACIWGNRCMYLGKQVHLFGLTGAPVLKEVQFLIPN